MVCCAKVWPPDCGVTPHVPVQGVVRGAAWADTLVPSDAGSLESAQPPTLTKEMSAATRLLLRFMLVLRSRTRSRWPSREARLVPRMSGLRTPPRSLNVVRVRGFGARPGEIDRR